MNITRCRRLAPALGALLLVQSACAVSVNPVSGRQRAYAYSWAEEVKMGREYDEEITASMGVYDDPALTAYVTRVGEAVLARSHLRREEALPEYRATAFTFRVLDSPEINAFALPGGYVYVTRGLLAHMENEAQLAMVLGHEVAHVAARHSSKQALEEGLGALGVAGLAVLSEELLGAGDAVETVTGLGVGLLGLRYSRDDERESDRLGVEYAALAGYRAAEGSKFFATLRRMEAREGGGGLTFLSTHPDPGRREESVTQMAAQWEAQGHAQTVLAEDAFWRAIDGMTVGANPRLGFVEKGTFYHPEGRFRFPVPRGWEAAQEGNEVTFGNAAETAALFFRFDARQGSAARAADRFVTDHEIQNPRRWSDEADGFPAVVVEAEEEGEGDEEGTRVRVHFVERDGGVLMFAGMAPTSEFGEVEAELDRTLRGLSELRDPRILNVQPTRLRVVAAPREAPFGALVTGTLSRDLTVEDLAMMNGVEPAALVPRGTRLKLPR